MTTRKMAKTIESSMFQDYPFKNVGYIFTHINRFFNPFKNFFPSSLDIRLFFRKVSRAPANYRRNCRTLNLFTMKLHLYYLLFKQFRIDYFAVARSIEIG